MITLALLVAVRSLVSSLQAPEVTLQSLLEEMHDLEALARLPAVPFTTVQFSSFDRRSTRAEAPDWLSNSDGFGGEPVPGFLEVLEPATADQTGLYLIADLEGPGAIVRGWSAGMEGVLQVFLDGGSTPWFEGTGYEFLARRSQWLFKQSGLTIEAGDAFVQQDADYFPVPFAEKLRVTWSGRLEDLHFYHLEIRRYPAATRVETLDRENWMAASRTLVEEAVARLTRPQPSVPGRQLEQEIALDPGERESFIPDLQGSGAVRELRFEFTVQPSAQALRGVSMQIAFDGSQRPQVEAPLGDFFASGPGLNAIESLPMSASPPATLTSRWVMPFQSGLAFHWWNTSDEPVRMKVRLTVSPWSWDARSMYYRARWRADHDLVQRDENRFDLPFVLLLGQGRFVGCAVMIANPAAGPHASGNWWGEGDEKIFVDGSQQPVFFGTGAEDYFNYSWSRCDLFDHPYCGQPLDSGPDTAGYVSNHRFHVLDSILFERSFGFWMELWQHIPTPGLSWSRIVYAYARPHALDDHRPLVAADLIVPDLPARMPQAVRGAAGSTILLAENLVIGAQSIAPEWVPHQLAPRGKLLQWSMAADSTLEILLTIDADGENEINLVMLHHHGGAAVEFALGGEPLESREHSEQRIRLETEGADRVLNVRLARRALTKGTHSLTLRCHKPGPVAIDYVWIQAVRQE